jgi:tetratricopeptide (TPR) repeat protein
MLYHRVGRLPEATHAVQEAVRLSPQRYSADLRLANYFLSVMQPQQALAALDDALRQAPAVALSETGENSLRFKAASAQADAWRMSGDIPRAVAAAETAVQLSPDDAAVWSKLGHLYERAGRVADQQRAEQRAAALASSTSQSPRP